MVRPANGGASVGHGSDGRVVFVDGALPGETVEVEITQEHKRHRRARLLRVVASPSPYRQEASCPTHASGCGGCDLAHVSTTGQLALKRSVVTDALRRLGRIESFPEPVVQAVTNNGYRTSVRAHIDRGGAGFRERQSHTVVPIDQCLVTHPALEELLTEASWGDNSEVRLRMSVATGQRLAQVDVDVEGVSVPDDVLVCGPGGLHPAECHVFESVYGRSWRVSAPSFFQSGPAAATLLVDTVGRAIGEMAERSLVDAYCGVGLFAGSLGAGASKVTGIELSSSSVADARVNLRDIGADIIRSKVERWAATPADVVVADPSRAGLKAEGVAALTATNCERFVLVSCDPGSMGRDIGLLAATGFTIDAVFVLDTFPDTSHVETVISLSR